MKALVLSDIHTEFWEAYAVEKSRMCDDPDESVVYETLDYLWNLRGYPLTEAIIVPGDIGNDWLTWSRTVKWLAQKYQRVYLCPGNHDIVVRGGTPSESNLQFTSSEQKIEAMRKHCEDLGNVSFLEGDTVDGIGGCMGMCDFNCEPPAYGLDRFTLWKRKWFDGKFWRYFNQEPQKIWMHYEDLLDKIVEAKPKVIVTHFAPYQVGVNWKYRMNNFNYVFYFDAQKWLDKIDQETWWL